MVKSILFVVAALVFSTASAHHNELHSAQSVAKVLSKAMDRELSQEEMNNVSEMVKVLQAENKKGAVAQAAEVAPLDKRIVGYNLGCVTVKGAVLLASTQKLVCTNLQEVILISKAVDTNDTGTFNVSANAGLVYARMFVTEDANRDLQGSILLQEPVDAIGIDGSYIGGAQVVFFSSPNVTLQLWGVIAGAGGGYVFEQNGAVDRATWEGTTLNIKKFDF